MAWPDQGFSFFGAERIIREREKRHLRERLSIMASIAYALDHVSPAPMAGERKAAASQHEAERETVGSSYAPRSDVDDPVRTVGQAHQTARECDARAEGRLEERRRIARELHDTLLQSFQASLIQMHVARKILFSRPEQAAQELDDVINVAASAIAEARQAIQELRCQTVDPEDLGKLLTLAAQEFAPAQERKKPAVRFRVIVEGQRQPLTPLVQEEVYQIGRELLRNAFRHARPSQIEAELRYHRRCLCLYVRDNGTGIGPEVLDSGGRDGHWGLRGIRERSERIGATLEFWTKKGAGTEVRLTVPASMAFGSSGRASFFRGFGRKHRTDKGASR